MCLSLAKKINYSEPLAGDIALKMRVILVEVEARNS